MATSQIRQPSQEELLRAFTAGQTPFDPTQAAKGTILGEDLAATILKNKQAQEDRVRQLAEKIAQAKKEAAFVKGVQAGPTVTSIVGRPVTASQTIQGVQPADRQLGEIAAAFPKETATDLLKERILEKSEAGKLERAKLRQEKENTAPDRIKQVFEVNGQPMALTYGNKLVPVPVPAGGKLNPLNKTLPADIAQQIGDFNTLSDQLQTVKSTYKPEYTGAVQARTGELAQTLDIPKIGLGAETGRADFYANVNSIRNQLLYLRSGKQINEKEYERLVAELPNEKRSDVDFEAKLANFEKVFEEIKANRVRALTTGYEVPGANPPPTGNGQIDALAAALGLKKKPTAGGK